MMNNDDQLLTLMNNDGQIFFLFLKVCTENSIKVTGRYSRSEPFLTDNTRNLPRRWSWSETLVASSPLYSAHSRLKVLSRCDNNRKNSSPIRSTGGSQWNLTTARENVPTKKHWNNWVELRKGNNSLMNALASHKHQTYFPWAPSNQAAAFIGPPLDQLIGREKNLLSAVDKIQKFRCLADAKKPSVAREN